MKRLVSSIAIVLLAGVMLAACGKSKTTSGTSGSSASSSGSKVVTDACTIFTDTIAKQVLGDTATKVDTSIGNVSSNDTDVSSCTYHGATTGVGASGSNPVATLQVRSGKSSAGIETNKGVFSSAKPAGVEDVSGYGDAAYWNPQVGQLNVLAHNNWYILSDSVHVLPAQKTLDEVKVLADALKDKL